MGVIVGLKDDHIEVQVDDKIHQVYQSKKFYCGSVVFKSKFPLKIGYAMTIHKAQGMTIKD